jgi:tRNA-splicing ligase RtcB
VDAETLGIVPGSMGSPTFHVAGRAVAEALCSAAHGAGRALSRSEARQRVNVRELDSQMRGVWFDARLRRALREEAPSAYKDVGAVMRAQRELVRIVRNSTPYWSTRRSSGLALPVNAAAMFAPMPEGSDE